MITGISFSSGIALYPSRNPLFILTKEDWILFPAQDLNPSLEKVCLVLNIDTDNIALDFEQAKVLEPISALTKNQVQPSFEGKFKSEINPSANIKVWCFCRFQIFEFFNVIIQFQNSIQLFLLNCVFSIVFIQFFTNKEGSHRNSCEQTD
jgi:hypothetical protein